MEVSRDDDLEPFLSEARDETLPPVDRLGSLLYLEARETFLSAKHRAILEAAREGIVRVLDPGSRVGGPVEPTRPPAPPPV